MTTTPFTLHDAMFDICELDPQVIERFKIVDASDFETRKTTALGISLLQRNPSFDGIRPLVDREGRKTLESSVSAVASLDEITRIDPTRIFETRGVLRTIAPFVAAAAAKYPNAPDTNPPTIRQRDEQMDFIEQHANSYATLLDGVDFLCVGEVDHFVADARAVLGNISIRSLVSGN